VVEVGGVRILGMESSQMEATDWLDEAVQQTKEKYQAERALEDKVIQEEALKARLASKFCAELFAWLETIDVKFNTRFGGQVLAVSPIGGKGDSALQVLAQPSRAQERIAELNYQGDINCLALSMSSGATATTQIIKMVRSAGGGILAEIGGERYTPDQLGQKIINDLLGIGFTPSVSRSRSSEPPCCSVSSNNIEMLHRTMVAGRSNGGCTVALG
jgi:hypothetical protein